MSTKPATKIVPDQVVIHCEQHPGCCGCDIKDLCQQVTPGNYHKRIDGMIKAIDDSNIKATSKETTHG
ncbi:hypothetical protein [Oceanobacter sp. 3_MG-2023]|uniref:hypothetical protein n=1 Tax=Oceanobacter sp. 3_MG-2023 TaxID=3062622 RepID=UPI0027347A0B|nr:hypothetical protein [Oceanobacter sp. 3_MG-2023]MDP2505415.1 hypothetical protein [Oceanobacter sp. 3_MG-2023]